MELDPIKTEQEMTQSSVPVLVDFYADWCGPCKIMKPIIEEIKKELGGKAKVIEINVDENQALAEKFSVLSIPTYLIFKNGKVAEHLLGTQPKDKLVKLLT